jgi:hypothetical protein
MNEAIVALLIIVALSTLVAGWLAAQKEAERPVKVMIFVGYFWLLAFIQLFLASSGYFVWQHFIVHAQ